MVRVYKAKIKKYSEEDLEKALSKIRSNKLSIRKAAEKYGIDKSTLQRRFHKGGPTTDKRGLKTVFSEADETILGDNLRTMAKWGFALLRKEVQEVVRDYVLSNKLTTPFKNDTPGYDWCRNFEKRQKLTLKSLEPLEASRRKATADPFIIFEFYRMLGDTISHLNLENSPSKIWNLDETYICSDPGRLKFVAGKGQKAHRVIQGSGKQNTTILGCCSASGVLLPPLIVFEGMHLWTSWKGDADMPGTFYSVAENGYMTSPVFEDYFVKFCKAVSERPLLLIFDGHMTHLTTTTIMKAIDENITIIKLPPHTTETLQPLDKCCFKGMKTHWNEQLLQWQRSNQRLPTKGELVNLLCKIWNVSIHKDNIISGFRSTGIYPVDSGKYPVDRLDPEKYERYKNRVIEPTLAASVSMSTSSSPSVSPTASRSRPASENESSIGNNMSSARFGISQEQSPSSKEQPSTSTPSTTSSSFESLLLAKIKRSEAPQKARRKIDPHSRVITSEEYVRNIKEKEELMSRKGKKTAGIPIKNAKSTCKKVRPAKRPTPIVLDDSDSTTTADESFVIENSDDDGDAEICELEPALLTNPENMVCGDFILVKFPGGKRNSTTYRYACIVQEINDCEVTVMSMIMLDEKKMVFKMKDNDISVVDKNAILGKLPIPKLVMMGDRVKYVFNNPVDVFQAS